MIFDERTRQRQRIIAHRHRTHPQHKPWGIETFCCVCKRKKVIGEWMYFPPQVEKDKRSHGYCKSCFENVMKGLQKERNKK